MKIDHIEIAKLEIGPGDILLVRVPADWSDEQQRNAHDAVKTAMRQADRNAPILIGPDSVDFRVVRKAFRILDEDEPSETDKPTHLVDPQ